MTPYEAVRQAVMEVEASWWEWDCDPKKLDSKLLDAYADKITSKLMRSGFIDPDPSAPSETKQLIELLLQQQRQWSARPWWRVFLGLPPAQNLVHDERKESSL